MQVCINNASSLDVVERVVRGYADIGLVYDISVNTNAVQVQRLHSETIAGYCTPEFSSGTSPARAALAAAHILARGFQTAD